MFTEVKRLFYNDQLTVMMGLPKKVDSIDNVATVKLCCPLSHFVISLGRLPNASANCFLVSPGSFIRKYILSDMSNDRLTSC